jgi:hypothetical protein
MKPTKFRSIFQPLGTNPALLMWNATNLPALTANQFSSKVDQCVDLFYDVIWRCFDRHVPKSRANRTGSLPWDSKGLRVLKNKANSTAKKMKQCESRCLSNPNINNCECEQFRSEFNAARSEYQHVFNSEYDDYRKEIEGSIKTDPKTFFKYVNLKKNRVGLPSVMNFENKTASTNEDKCELFAEFIQRTCSDDQWAPSDSGPTVVSDIPPMGSLQFTVDEVEQALLDLDANKGPTSD